MKKGLRWYAGERGVSAIASPHALSTEAGIDSFRRGGNALDAALAAAASLAVTSPDNCAIGGDLIALVRDPSGAVTAVNASGPAAGAVDVERLRGAHGNLMPQFGAHTVTVPERIGQVSSTRFARCLKSIGETQ